MGRPLSLVSSQALFISSEDEQKKQYAYQLGGDGFRQGQCRDACPFENEVLKAEWIAGYNDQQDFWENSEC